MLRLPQGVTVSAVEDNLGDFVATYSFESTEHPIPGVSVKPTREFGRYEVVRKGREVRISVLKTTVGGDRPGGGPGAETGEPIDSGESWLFRDGQIVATVFQGYEYTSAPDAPAILDEIPPFTVGLDLTYSRGAFLTRDQLAARPGANSIEKAVESVDGKVVERSRGTGFARSFAHGSRAPQGFNTYDESGRLESKEAGAFLLFSDGRGAFVPRWKTRVDRWVDGVPARIEHARWRLDEDVLNSLESPEDCVARCSGADRSLEFELRMELTNFRLPTAEDRVTPADYASQIRVVRAGDFGESQPVWSGDGGESTRLLTFNASSNAWEPATAQP